jgi:dienelactone hydrolase
MRQLRKTGVIYSHPIFGITKTGRKFCDRLSSEGYGVEIVNLYQGQPITAPFFLPLVLGKNSKMKLNLIAAQFQDEAIMTGFQQAESALRERGYTKIVLVGFGLGGVYSLKYAEKHEEGFLDGVVAAYPHLLFPKGFPKSPPNIARIMCRVLMVFGKNDEMVEPGTLAYAKSLEEKHREDDTLIPLSVRFYQDANHAFFEKEVQSLWPNPFYNKEKAAQLDEEIRLFLRKIEM